MAVVVASAYCRRPPRFAYGLTDGGRDLVGALRLLSQWDAEHPSLRSAPAGVGGSVVGGSVVGGSVVGHDVVSDDDGLEAMRHRLCGTPVEVRWWCPTCAVGVDADAADDVRYA